MPRRLSAQAGLAVIATAATATLVAYWLTQSWPYGRALAATLVATAVAFVGALATAVAQAERQRDRDLAQLPARVVGPATVRRVADPDRFPRPTVVEGMVVRRVVDGVSIVHRPYYSVDLHEVPDLLSYHSQLPGRVTCITMVVARQPR